MDFQRDLYEIQLLRARYTRFMDTRNWERFRELFTEDLEYFVEFSREPESTTPTFRGPDELVGYLSKSEPTKVTVHHCHTPEIEFLDDDNATGIWAMFSWADEPGRNFAVQCYGHYHDRYVRGTDGRWRIASTHLTRLRQNRVDHLPSERVDVIDPVALRSVAPQS
jgi:hypothetical protein